MLLTQQYVLQIIYVHVFSLMHHNVLQFLYTS